MHILNKVECYILKNEVEKVTQLKKTVVYSENRCKTTSREKNVHLNKLSRHKLLFCVKFFLLKHLQISAAEQHSPLNPHSL